MRRSACIAATAALIALPSPASAVLLDRGNGLLYDTALNVTWLQNANPCDGCFLNWFDASAWAWNLEYAGRTDWRLPKIRPDYNFDGLPNLPPVDCSVASAAECIAGRNELGYMFFHNLGGTIGADKTGDQMATSGVLVHDLQGLYWGGNSEYPSPSARVFGFGPTFITESGTDALVASWHPESGARIWAVHPGDVAAVPEPSVVALMGVGALALVWNRKRRGRVTSLTPGTGCNA